MASLTLVGVIVAGQSLAEILGPEVGQVNEGQQVRAITAR
jgi:hypothetical protein